MVLRTIAEINFARQFINVQHTAGYGKQALLSPSTARKPFNKPGCTQYCGYAYCICTHTIHGHI
ncbi:hypothetical protein T11_7388 [Trichinella zimbabwensis]|uniref:Uncharacterized protein n=1 Tax=Trichinella zimbabwensis TaxID=268475 RepID=A0A0V1I0P4_9BILA|nr:hypothetical protein T11_7388 [Trichinella zimbabwensis]